MEDIRLVAVVVTYNRLEKLKNALLSYESQTRQCSDLIVVNNCSTDGTDTFLKNWEQKPSMYIKHVLKTDSNIGGAGGFYTGMEYALKIKSDWVWLSDDDAYPEPDTFAKIFNYISLNTDVNRVAAICSSVIKPDGSVDLGHRGFLSRGLCWNRIDSQLENYQCDEFKIDFLSYVGVAISAKALTKVGLCQKDYFIYFDDSEHSIRLREFGEILCIPNIHVVHDVYNENCSTEKRNYGWKTYYSMRNLIYSYLHHHLPSAIIWTLRLVIWQNFLFLTGRLSNKNRKLMMAAVRDGWKGNLGIHNLYKPGY